MGDQGAPGRLKNRGRANKFGGRLRSGGGGPRDERGECAGGICRQEREDEAGRLEDGLVAAQEGAKSAHIAGGRASGNSVGRKGSIIRRQRAKEEAEEGNENATRSQAAEARER